MAKANDGTADYNKAIAQLAKVIARWIAEDSTLSLDDYLTQVAEDLEASVAKEMKR